MQTILSPHADSKGQRVLAFGAHPDDLEVGAGGLLARLARQGADVTMVVCSVPGLLQQRVQEATKGAEIIGAEVHVIYGERPCRVEDIPMHELVARFDHLVSDLGPTLVITHSAKDLHWDHGLVNRATISALRRTPCDLLAFTCSPEMNAHAQVLGECFADIEETLDVKMEAINAHASQISKICVECTRDLARARGRLCGLNYAETFEVLRMRI